jgi:isochorismate synthase
VGASPETLLVVAGGRLRTEALAGSIPRHGDDASEIRELSTSDKDRREHAFVRDAIVAALQPLTTDVRWPAEPAIKTLRHVHHLTTPIEATLRESAHVASLAGRLHPTPAMAGWPTADARRFIRDHEGWSRGWYASPIGWFDAAGDGVFAVGIRSALIDATGAWVYAGAGVVHGSDAALECKETRAKQAGMLAALGVEP